MNEIWTYEDLKADFRMSDSGDPWGTCMGWLFAVAGEISDNRDFAVPDEWQYRPSPLGGVNPDAWESEPCRLATDEALQRFGDVLFRYSEKLRVAGRNY